MLSSVTTTVLKAPTGLSVTAGSNSEVLKWTDNTTTNSTVSIERSTDGTNWAVIASVNHGVQTYTNSTVTEGANLLLPHSQLRQRGHAADLLGIRHGIGRHSAAGGTHARGSGVFSVAHARRQGALGR